MRRYNYRLSFEELDLCQSAVQTIYDTAKRNDMLDAYDFNELTQHLVKVCGLIGLLDDFLEDDEE